MKTVQAVEDSGVLAIVAPPWSLRYVGLWRWRWWMGLDHEQVKSCRVDGDFVDVGYMYMQLHACKFKHSRFHIRVLFRMEPPPFVGHRVVS